MTSGDPTRLPKWAQNELRGLRMQLASLRREIDTLHANSGFTTGTGDDGLSGRHILRPVDPNATVRFTFTDGDDDGDDGYVNVRRDGDILEIMATRCLLVQPESGNVVRIIPTRDYR